MAAIDKDVKFIVHVEDGGLNRKIGKKMMSNALKGEKTLILDLSEIEVKDINYEINENIVIVSIPNYDVAIEFFDLLRKKGDINQIAHCYFDHDLGQGEDRTGAVLAEKLKDDFGYEGKISSTSDNASTYGENKSKGDLNYSVYDHFPGKRPNYSKDFKRVLKVEVGDPGKSSKKRSSKGPGM